MFFLKKYHIIFGSYIYYAYLCNELKSYIMPLTPKEIEALKETHEKIREVLMEYDNPEYGDCIIDDICEVVGIPPTTVYYIEGE